MGITVGKTYSCEHIKGGEGTIFDNTDRIRLWPPPADTQVNINQLEIEKEGLNYGVPNYDPPSREAITTLVGVPETYKALVSPEIVTLYDPSIDADGFYSTVERPNTSNYDLTTPLTDAIIRNVYENAYPDLKDSTNIPELPRSGDTVRVFDPKYGRGPTVTRQYVTIPNTGVEYFAPVAAYWPPTRYTSFHIILEPAYLTTSTGQVTSPFTRAYTLMKQYPSYFNAMNVMGKYLNNGYLYERRTSSDPTSSGDVMERTGVYPIVSRDFSLGFLGEFLNQNPSTGIRQEWSLDDVRSTSKFYCEGGIAGSIPHSYILARISDRDYVIELTRKHDTSGNYGFILPPDTLREAYVLTSPGRLDSDFVTQVVPESVVGMVSPGAKVIETGSINIIDHLVEGQLADIGENINIGTIRTPITLSGEPATVSVEGVVGSMTFHEFDNTSLLRFDNHIWRILSAREATNNDFIVSLTREA